MDRAIAENALGNLMHKGRCAGAAVLDSEAVAGFLTFSVHHAYSIGFAVGASPHQKRIGCHHLLLNVGDGRLSQKGDIPGTR